MKRSLQRKNMLYLRTWGFYKVPADKRDLNYDKYFVEGDQKLSSEDEYNSHNTERLNIEQIKEKLLQLDYVREQLESWDR